MEITFSVPIARFIIVLVIQNTSLAEYFNSKQLLNSAVFFYEENHSQSNKMLYETTEAWSSLVSTVKYYLAVIGIIDLMHIVFAKRQMHSLTLQFVSEQTISFC